MARLLGYPVYLLDSHVKLGYPVRGQPVAATAS